MDIHSSSRKALCALATALWTAACSGDNQSNGGDAGAQDATAQDVASDHRNFAIPLEGGAAAMAEAGEAGACLPVAATCDGPEDCPSGQTCCGTLDLSLGGYTKIACQPSPCVPADGGIGAGPDGGDGGVPNILVLELCRADTMCHDNMGLVCGTSIYLPPFLYRCNTASTPPPATATGVPGHVACGMTNCATGEQCCILGQTGQTAPAYCAPLGQACSCTVPVAEGGSDAGMIDATAADATGEAGDAQPESSSDAGAEAGSDAGGDSPADAHE